MSRPCVTVLNAGPGMGFYVPGVIMARQLNEAGVPAKVHVFESFYKRDKKNIIPRMKSKFHKSFSFALMGQNIASDPGGALDEELVAALYKSWIQEKRQYFVVFSGFWIPVLNRFLEMTDSAYFRIDLCHLDADYSVSWKMHDCRFPSARTHWFHSWENRKVNYHMDVDASDPIPFHDRNNNLVIHGGGWGLGDFEAKGEELIHTHFSMSVIVYEDPDSEKVNPKADYYFLDPKWNIWELNENNEHTFPPLYYLNKAANNQKELLDNSHSSPLYKIVRNSKAIISKPGAGTLIDSLSSATPLITLEPYGNSENKNGMLWKAYGLGMSFEDWRETNFSTAVLEQIHRNLLNIRSETPNFITSYINHHGL
ncbi:hypothetical protein SAMN05443550_109201 [Pedobacter hartonius]|uniref:UDP-glucuronosyltransferase n=2 Tax=Pedobacter hartonius TaxID=425514 RepID=A0A1H4GC03_9SPHI|nr:hypothetical protein SAMN05443550_109201 [Pedobacter hartonius]